MICSVGEILIDFFQAGENSSSFPVLSAMPGGAPANFICAVKAAGGEGAFIGKVGKDAFGKRLKNLLENKGIDSSGLVEDGGVFTTLAFVTLDSLGDRSFSFARKPGADTLLSFEEIDLSLIDRCTCLHFGSLSFTDEPSRSAVKEAVSYARSKGKLISYDPNYRALLWKNEEDAKEQMLQGFYLADTVKLSLEEAQLLFSEDEKGAADILINEYGCSLVFVTLGELGCYFKNEKGFGYARSRKAVTPVDTTGAGDIFGGTAAALIERSGKHPRELTEKELSQIAEEACTIASLSTEKQGGML